VEDAKSLSDLSLVVPNYRMKRAKSDEPSPRSSPKPASPKPAGAGGGAWSFFAGRSS